jgi:hypothetical protein
MNVVIAKTPRPLLWRIVGLATLALGGAFACNVAAGIGEISSWTDVLQKPYETLSTPDIGLKPLLG